MGQLGTGEQQGSDVPDKSTAKRPGRTPHTDTKETILSGAQVLIAEKLRQGEVILNHVPLRAVARAAEVSPQTVVNHFTDIAHIGAALVKRDRDAGRDSADPVKALAALHYSRAAKDPQVLVAASLGRPNGHTVEDARELLVRANGQPNVAYRIRAHTALAAALLAVGTTDTVREAFTLAKAAEELVDDGDFEHIQAAIEATTLGAEASRLLSREDAAESKYLSYVEDFKKAEALYATRLHVQARAAMAHFHADRANALIKGEPDREVEAFAKVADRLEQARKDGEPINPSDLSLLISRICMTQMAYPQHREALREPRRKLLLMTKSPARSSVLALIRVVDVAPDYSADTTATHLVRLTAFGTVGYLCIARILRAKHAVAAQLAAPDTGSSTDGAQASRHAAAFGISPNISHALEIEPREYLVAALTYYQRVIADTRASGAAGILRAQAAAERAQLLEEYSDEEHTLERASMPAMDDETVAGIAEAIDRLVMAGLVAERANRKQLTEILKVLEPIHSFLSQPARIPSVVVNPEG